MSYSKGCQTYECPHSNKNGNCDFLWDIEEAREDPDIPADECPWLSDESESENED